MSMIRFTLNSLSPTVCLQIYAELWAQKPFFLLPVGTDILRQLKKKRLSVVLWIVKQKRKQNRLPNFVMSVHKARVSVILCPHSGTMRRFTRLLLKTDTSFLFIVWWAFIAQIFVCIVAHHMWHSRTSDLWARGGICLPQYELCGDDVFLWATGSRCTINLLLCPCCFFVWDDE